jgi:chemotaxis protein CheZ
LAVDTDSQITARERRRLASSVSRARREIAKLGDRDFRAEGLPRAVNEMHAVVRMTERAANTIMEATEEIARADLSDRHRAERIISHACTRIFEACAFQDVTSQRITKVLRTLRFVAARIARLQAIFGLTAAGRSRRRARMSGHGGLLSGPALDGEGIDQGEADRIMERS